MVNCLITFNFEFDPAAERFAAFIQMHTSLPKKINNGYNDFLMKIKKFLSFVSLLFISSDLQVGDYVARLPLIFYLQ